MNRRVRGALAGKMRLPLPDIIDPPKRRCVTIEIPDDRMHFAVFWGWLYGLTRWYTWKLDSSQTGKALAVVYQKVWADARERFVLQEDSCMGCAHVNPAMSAPLSGGETRTFHTTVEAGEFQLLPIVLLRNQSITLSDFKGQWRDSQYHPDRPCTSNWETPEGIVIDQAGGALAENFPTDVMPGEPHMRLIMRVNACGVLSYHHVEDPITFTVPNSAHEDGVFVEFLGNCPVDGNNEIAPGFLGYGMVCLSVIVSDPNVCASIFIDFEPPSFPNFTLVEGSIVATSPIDEGAALRRAVVSLTTAQAQIWIDLDDCTLVNFAFTAYMVASASSTNIQLRWDTFDPDGVFIQGALFQLNINDLEATSYTVNPAQLIPHVGQLRLKWTMNNTIQSDQGDFYIDNVFVN